MDTADILFIASDPREFAAATRFWRDVRPISLPVHWAREGIRKGKRVIAVANGAGAERARLAAKSIQARTICNIGFCGALDPALKIGDILVPGTAPATPLPYITGRLICSDHTVVSAAEKAALHAQGGTAVDMESEGLPGAYFVKSVSDVAGENLDTDFNGALLPDGRFSVVRILKSAMQRPLVRIPELIRLQKNTRIAAEALGAFLDRCEF